MALKYNKRYKYAQLCKELDLPRLSGSKQRKQLSDLSKKYEITKDSNNNYIIKKNIVT